MDITTIALFTGSSVLVGLVAYYVVSSIVSWWRRRKFKKALDGDYGDEARWTTELIDEEDEMFIRATPWLSSNDRREVSIIAESKEELRELVIERAEENGFSKDE